MAAQKPTNTIWHIYSVRIFYIFWHTLQPILFPDHIVSEEASGFSSWIENQQDEKPESNNMQKFMLENNSNSYLILESCYVIHYQLCLQNMKWKWIGENLVLYSCTPSVFRLVLKHKMKQGDLCDICAI